MPGNLAVLVAADAPFGELPVLTKATLLDNFDAISTDPAVRLGGLQAFLDGPDGRLDLIVLPARAMTAAQTRRQRASQSP